MDPHVSTKFKPQINFVEEEPKKRNFQRWTGFEMPSTLGASVPAPANANHTRRVSISTKMKLLVRPAGTPRPRELAPTARVAGCHRGPRQA